MCRGRIRLILIASTLTIAYTNTALIHLEDNKRKRPYDTIGGAIKHFRKKQGYTQEQLGKRIGVCQASVAHYEGNRVVPPVRVLKLLSRELGCSLSLLIDHRMSILDNL